MESFFENCMHTYNIFWSDSLNLLPSFSSLSIHYYPIIIPYIPFLNTLSLFSFACPLLEHRQSCRGSIHVEKWLSLAQKPLLANSSLAGDRGVIISLPHQFWNVLAWACLDLMYTDTTFMSSCVLENTVSLHSSIFFGSCNVSYRPFEPLQEKLCDIDDPFNNNTCHSLHVDQSWVSMLIASYCKKKRLWWVFRVVQSNLERKFNTVYF